MINLERINNWFYSYGKWLIRNRLWYFLCFALFLFVVILGLPKLESSADEDNWFGKKDRTIIEQNEMEEIFGNTDIAAVHVSAENIFTKQNLELIRKLGQELEDNVPYADDVFSITSLEYSQGTEWGIEIEDLIPEEIPDDPQMLAELQKKAVSKELIKGQVISEDCTEGWIILRLLRYDDGDDNATLKIGKGFLDIVNKPEYAPLNPRATGVPVLMYEKTKFFSYETPRVMKFSFLVVFLILLVSLRSLRGIVIPFLTIGFSLVIVFGVQGHIGFTIDPTVVTMPIFLGFAVAVGYNIHIFHFFNNKRKLTGQVKESVYYTLQESGWPILFTALTTILALCSFLFISSPLLKWIGIASAAIVFVSLLLVLSFTPILLSFGKDKAVVSEEAIAKNARANKWLAGFSDWIFANRKKIIFFYLLITMIGACGFFMFRISFSPTDSIGVKVPYVKRVDEIAHSQIGALSSYNIIIEFPENEAVKNPENMKNLDELIKFIETKTVLTKRVTSIVKIIKDMNKVLFDNKDSEYKIPDTRQAIAQELLLYENSGGTEATRWIDYDYKRYRIQVELPEMDTELADQDIAKIKAEAKKLFPNAKIKEVGTLAKMIAMAERVTHGQLYSFLIALIIVAIILMIAFGGVRVGLVGMIPNITPAILAGGAMGYLDIPLDMITVTIMPMILGLAVDDTIHFINHYKLYYNKYGDYKLASSKCFSSIGMALITTSVILILNYAVYLTSVAKMLTHVGLLAIIGISSALLSDFFITPILIRMLEPFGKHVEFGEKNEN